MAGHILWQLLGWPAGIILGNLLASVIWSSLFEWRLRKHHKKTTAAVDASLAAHHQNIKNLLDEHHEKVIKAVNNVTT